MHALKRWTAGLAVLTAGAAVYAVSRGVQKARKYHRDYHPATTETLTGTIAAVDAPEDDKAMARGTIISLRVDGDPDSEPIAVHMGPAWFINREFKPFKAGEAITVTGSHSTYKDEDIFVAALLERGKNRYRLRDEQGVPAWDIKIQ